MTRKSLVVLLALGVCVPLSCNMLAEVHIDAPPQQGGDGGEAAERWWDKTVDSLPLPFLAAFAEASEVHLKKKTTATYIDWYQSFSSGGIVQLELHLPSPPPERAFARIRERVQGFKIGDPPALGRRQDHVIMAEECQGCSPHQAMEVWHDALKKVGLPVPKPPAPVAASTKPSPAANK